MDKKEKVLIGKIRKKLQDISHYNQKMDGRAEWKAGYFKGKKETLAEVKKIIAKDTKYQKTKLTGNFEKDKPINWRLEGYKHIEQKLGIK